MTLSWTNGQGLNFTRTISVDKDFLFTVADQVANTGTVEARLAPYGIIARHGLPKLEGVYVVHEGPVRRIDGDLAESSYGDLPKQADFEGAKGEAIESTGDGWIGFTDHYWMTTLIPEQGKPFTAVTKYTPTADIYQTEVRQPLMTVAPGATAQSSIRLFAGAKEWEAIAGYENNPGWLARLFGDRRVGAHPHALGDRGRAAGLHLGHPGDLRLAVAIRFDESRIDVSIGAHLGHDRDHLGGADVQADDQILAFSCHGVRLASFDGLEPASGRGAVLMGVAAGAGAGEHAARTAPIRIVEVMRMWVLPSWRQV